MMMSFRTWLELVDSYPPEKETIPYQAFPKYGDGEKPPTKKKMKKKRFINVN